MSTWDARIRDFEQGATEHTEARDQKRFTPEWVNPACHRIIGAAIDVHRHLGPGFLESIYESALAMEFGLRAVPFTRQTTLPVTYKGQLLGEHRADLIVDGVVVVELKAVETLLPIHAAQVLSYMKAGAFQVGLLINFNVHILKNGIKRLVWDL